VRWPHVGEEAALALLPVRGPRQLRVALVDVHRRARRPHRLGHADVVGMGVGEQHRVDVRERPPPLAQERLELAEEAGQRGVDEQQPAVPLDEVEVHELVAEPVDPRGDLHDPPG
jgi:hypothetical protein